MPRYELNDAGSREATEQYFVINSMGTLCLDVSVDRESRPHRTMTFCRDPHLLPLCVQLSSSGGSGWWPRAMSSLSNLIFPSTFHLCSFTSAHSSTRTPYTKHGQSGPLHHAIRYCILFERGVIYFDSRFGLTFPPYVGDSLAVFTFRWALPAV